MKSWKDKWNDELDSMLPEKIGQGYQPKQDQSKGVAHVLSLRKKWSIGIVSFVLIFVLVLGLIFSLNGTQKSSSVLAIEINPSVVFVVNEDGKVTDVQSLNFDADVILSDDSRVSELVNKPVQTAVNTFVDYAIELGYMDVNEDTMKITGVDDVVDTVKAQTQKYLNDKGANVIVQIDKVVAKEFGKLFGEDNVSNVNDIINVVRNTPKLFTDKDIANKSLPELKNDYIEQVKGQIIRHIEELNISNEIKNFIIDLVRSDDFVDNYKALVDANIIPDIIPKEFMSLLNADNINSVDDYKNGMGSLKDKVFNDRKDKHNGKPKK